jgi:hypothetical protein
MMWLKQAKRISSPHQPTRGRSVRTLPLALPAPQSFATAGAGQLGAIHATVPSFRVEISPIDVRDTSEIEHAFGGEPNGS